MRKLASIQLISSLQDHPNADSLELAQVNGWQVVVKKGEFSLNMPIIFVEPDAVLPPWPEFEFLAKSKYRIKTIKLRGQVSQGLVLPFDIVPGLESTIMIGQDVTELLQVTKYESDIEKSMNQGGSSNTSNLLPFPSHIPKTDQERVQNLGNVLEKYQYLTFVVTEKLDGSSITIYIDDKGELAVASRNYTIPYDPNNIFWKAVDQEIKPDVHRKTGESLVNYMKDQNISLQGELVGPGIQGNKYNLEEPLIFLFGMFVSGKKVGYRYLQQLVEEFEIISTVPLLNDNYVMTPDRSNSKFWLDAVKGQRSALRHSVQAEGVVVETIVNCATGLDNSFTRPFLFKAINQDWLLANEK